LLLIDSGEIAFLFYQVISAQVAEALSPIKNYIFYV